MKRALVVIAPDGFQDYEYSAMVSELKKAGILVGVFSIRDGICIGSNGGEVEAQDIGKAIKEEFDAVVFIGGPGTPTVRADERAIELVRYFSIEKVVAAICWAPTILAKAGVLKGKKATVWLGDDPEYKKSTDKVLEQYGAKFENRKLVEDDNIITANGPSAAAEFGKKLARKIIG